jgi:hypothetical protein
MARKRGGGEREREREREREKELGGKRNVVFFISIYLASFRNKCCLFVAAVYL